MHLNEVFNTNMVWAELSSTTKTGIIKELSNLIADRESKLSSDTINRVLTEREELGSTGIEDGIAIPHAKVPELEHIIVACGRSPAGLDFGAHDSKPTHLFFVLLAPMNATGMHLKVLARLSRLLKESRVRSKLLEAKTSDEMHDIVVEEDNKF